MTPGPAKPKGTVLLIDDDPSHLRLYSMIVEEGGFRALTALAVAPPLALPTAEPVHVIALDYKLGPKIKATDVAQQVHATYRTAALLVLSDLSWMPDDMKPYSTNFVRKGEPEELLRKLNTLLQPSS